MAAALRESCLLTWLLQAAKTIRRWRGYRNTLQRTLDESAPILEADCFYPARRLRVLSQMVHDHQGKLVAPPAKLICKARAIGNESRVS